MIQLLKFDETLQPSGPGWLQPLLAVEIAFQGLQRLRRRPWQMGSHLGKWSLPFGFQCWFWHFEIVWKFCSCRPGWTNAWGESKAVKNDNVLQAWKDFSCDSAQKDGIFRTHHFWNSRMLKTGFHASSQSISEHGVFFWTLFGGVGAWDRYCDGQWKRHGLSIDSYHEHRMILPPLRMAVHKLFAWALASSWCFFCFPTFEAKRVSASIDCFLSAAASCCFGSWILSACAPWNDFWFQGAARDDWPSQCCVSAIGVSHFARESCLNRQVLNQMEEEDRNNLYQEVDQTLGKEVIKYDVYLFGEWALIMFSCINLDRWGFQWPMRSGQNSTVQMDGHDPQFLLNSLTREL